MTTLLKGNDIMIRQVGVTPEGVRVVANTFKMFDAYGLPLDIMLDLMKDNNMIPDWIDFCNEAMISGWKNKTIIDRVKDAVETVYGTDFTKEVLSRLKLYIEHMPV